tara:strand:- start:228 stop:701 length:474 start_codon:yes stop_codon:yes gene_type:complete
MTFPKKIKIKKINDIRGSFLKILSYKQKKIILNNQISEINISINKKKGTIRGMHYQSRFKEKKIVYCLKGKIIDYCINVKNNKKYKFFLDEKDKDFLYVPENFAHGFQTLKNNTILIYIHSNLYSKKYEKSINPFSKKINIKWPIKKYVISKKDKNS